MVTVLKPALLQVNHVFSAGALLCVCKTCMWSWSILESIQVLKYIRLQTTTDWAWRYLIVFVDRPTSDEWWRAVTDSVDAGYNRFDGVKRISPQFYIHNPDVNAGNIALTLTDNRVASKFLNRVFFTLLNDRDARILSVTPVLNYVDHISGNG